MLPNASVSCHYCGSLTHKQGETNEGRTVFDSQTEFDHKYRPSEIYSGKTASPFFSGRPRIVSMTFFFIFVFGILLVRGHYTDAASFTAPLATTTQHLSNELETIRSKFIGPPPLTSLPVLSRVTPPPSLHHLDLRQRCWNDQGFSVDCAVWTGYRYTWGPYSNPYDYWSGNGRSGSGGGSSIASGAVKPNCVQIHAVLFIIYICVSHFGLMPIF